MQAGGKREWARPMNPRATGRQPYGSWRGRWDCYNVVNRQPGFHYTLADPESLYRYQALGFEAVRSDRDPERFIGSGHVHIDAGTQAKNCVQIGRFVLMRIPVENPADPARSYRGILERRQRRRMEGMDIPTATLIDQSPAERERLARLSAHGRNYVPNGDVYFPYPEHGRNGYHEDEVEVLRNGSE